MKKISVYILNVLFLCLIATSCSSGGTKKIGLLISASSVDRYVQEGNCIKERAAELGYEVLIEFAENNDALQISHAHEMIDKVDGLCLIAVNGITAAEIVREYKSAGKPVIAYNRLIQNCEPDFFITGDNSNLAEMMVGVALKSKPHGNYYLLGGDKFDINGIQLQNAIDSLLKPYEESGAINVVFRGLTQDWNSDLAAENLRKAINLSGIKPDVIISAYDGMSQKSVDVLKEIYGEVGDVVITGQDAEMRAIRNIARGEQTMTAYHSPKNNGYAGAEAIVALIEGKNISKAGITRTNNGLVDVPTIKIPSILITKDNYDDILIKGGVYSKQQVDE